MLSPGARSSSSSARAFAVSRSPRRNVTHPWNWAATDPGCVPPPCSASQPRSHAAELSTRLGKPQTAGQVRVTLHRARARFAELLVDEVARSLGSPEPAELVQEIRDLDLLKYCRNALKRRGIDVS